MQGRKLNEEEWEKGKVHIKASELEMGPKIAEGKYGTVFKGKCRGQTVAIKLLHNQHLSEEKLEELKTEVEIMTRLRHPCILLLMGVCTDPNNIALVMEYVEGKGLDRILHDAKVTLTQTQQLRIAKDIAKGMNWLHCLDPPIIHRDIKPPNILVTANFDVKVCDFGLSCVIEIPKPNEKLRDTAVGSPIWMAPEVLSGHLASEKSDVYAYAIVLWEILTRKPPFSDVRSFEEFLDDVIDNDKRPPIPESTHGRLKALIQRCWDGNPKKRPYFSEILNEMDEILVEMLIKDDTAKDMWKSMKSTDFLGEHYPFFVPWEGFLEQLANALETPDLLKPNNTDKGYLCLRTILATPYKDFTRDRPQMTVTCESFGRFLDCFGPLVEDDCNIVTKLTEICEKSWFHGDIGRGDAESRLNASKENKRGLFLVRLSSNNDSCFTISRINKDNKIVHQRIARDKRGNYVVQVGEEIKAFRSLIDLIESQKGEKDLNLKTPCSEGRSFAIIFAPLIESRGYLSEIPATEASSTSLLSSGASKSMKSKTKKKPKEKKERNGKTSDKKTKKSVKKEKEK